ncbi:MAG: hypothetical protein H7Y88_08850 [Phycisphaerales bacterium]|nr:hypothetical protein [Phycisphaerales bacterium]
MILSIAAIAIVGVIAYVWSARGFFSALIHMVCTLAAGAIAFGVWEWVANLILAKGSGQWMADMAWGAALAIPFAASLAVLRLGIDKLLPANADLDGATNLIGGGLCGLVSGTISAGILILSIGYLRLPTNFMGFRPVQYASSGSLERQGGLLFPVDRITAGLYSHLSTTTLNTGNPLAEWHPNLADEGPLLRTNFNEGGSRHVAIPGAYKVMGRYTVGKAAGKLNELTADSFDPSRKQIVTSLRGEPVDPNSYVEGIVVQFSAKAREKEGKVVVGNAQVRLIVEDAEGSTFPVHPFAMVSQASGDKVDFGRWRFDSPDVFIASVGASDAALMSFEFLVPRGTTPKAIYVKGAREELIDLKPFQEYPDASSRDKAIKSRTMLAQAEPGGGTLDTSRAVKVGAAEFGGDADIVFSSRIPGATISKDNVLGLELDGNKVTNGSAKFTNTDLSRNRGLDRQLQVSNFAGSEDTVIVQVDVGKKRGQDATATSAIGFLSDAAADIDRSQRPALIDENGTRYPALGYVYKDQTETHIQFSPGNPIANVDALPALSRSRPDQELALVFSVSQGVKIKYFAVGDKVIAEFSPTIEAQGR